MRRTNPRDRRDAVARVINPWIYRRSYLGRSPFACPDNTDRGTNKASRQGTTDTFSTENSSSTVPRY